MRILPERVEAEFTFARADIETLIALDADGDGKVSALELALAKPAVEALARQAWGIRVDDTRLDIEKIALVLDETNNLHLKASFPMRTGRTLTAHALLIDRLPRGHRQFVTLLDSTNGVVAELLLSAQQDVIAMDLKNVSGAPASPPAARTFSDFLKLGIEHIITGYDHLLFLFALLMVAPRFREAALIITSFTVAHSITLALATLNVVRFGSQFVEPLIAASIVYVGIENLFYRGAAPARWRLTFAFGLVHGFGFASALRDLGVHSGTTGIVLPLLSFNLGVEAGQVMTAALVLPLIWWARKAPSFVRFAVPACSGLVIALGGWWLLMRTVL